MGQMDQGKLAKEEEFLGNQWGISSWFLDMKEDAQTAKYSKDVSHESSG